MIVIVIVVVDVVVDDEEGIYDEDNGNLIIIIVVFVLVVEKKKVVVVVNDVYNQIMNVNAKFLRAFVVQDMPKMHYLLVLSVCHILKRDFDDDLLQLN